MKTNKNSKKIFKISLFLLGIGIIFSLGINTTAAANTSSIYVNAHGNNSWNGLNSSYTNGLNGPKATIKNATGTVKSGGTVYIASGVYNENNIQINTDMNIIGETQKTTIINGQKSGNSIFTIESGITVTISNLTLTNGTVMMNNGGAIENWGTLTVDNSTFTNNTVTMNNGGAISNEYGANLTVNNSTFIGNTMSDGSGGAIDNIGTLIVDNSNFIGNYASGKGGAINNEYGGTSYVNNSTFTGNTAWEDSGAISNEYGATLTVNNSNFTGNAANVGGGGAVGNGGSLTIINSIFTGNNASGGGAISNTGSLTVDNSIFLDNSVLSDGMSQGGAIYNEGSLTVGNSTFTGNTATSGGLIYNSGTVVFNFNRIVGNHAVLRGNSIFNSDGTVDARYNWWGSNKNPSTDISGPGVTYNPWIVLTVTKTPKIINGNSTVTADLLHDSNGSYHDPVNGHVPDGISVNFSSTNGSVNPISSIMVNDTANTSFTGPTQGASTIRIMVDQQTTVIMNTIPTLVTVKPVSGNNGSTVKLTATLTDTYGNPINDAIVQFLVNGIVIGTATTNNNGIATLQYKISKTNGNYIILAEYLGSNTYTESENTNHLTVNKPLTPVVIVSDTNVTSIQNIQRLNPTTVKAVTTTIPMQHTGVPIAGLIFGILSVLGGSIMSRKR